MSGVDREEALNLSGDWRGLFNYPRLRAPVGFTANLTETDGWLVGATEEIDDSGNARGLTISATLQGRRTGRSVTWLKLYDGASRDHDSVNYTGDVNDDGTEIHGRWTIPGVWSGAFLMIRSSGVDAALRRKAMERV